MRQHSIFYCLIIRSITAHRNYYIVKYFYPISYFLLLNFLFLNSCKSDVTNIKAQYSPNIDFENIEVDSLVDLEFQSDQSKKSNEIRRESRSVFTLNKEWNYVPVVESCLYIRTEPKISDFTIIQCLIPIRTGDLITEMWHQLKPTGKVKGDWAQFDYEFKIYTIKPDSPNAINFEEWDIARKKAHVEMKIKFKSYQTKGWVKYRNTDGSLNIKRKRDGC